MASSQGSLDADMADPIHISTSDYEEENELSQFTSFTSTRQFFKFEQGRRYQALLHDRYGLPNDDMEQMREGIKHQFHIDYILNGDLHVSPLENPPQKVVDLGTGAGFWAQDVAERYTSAHVIGVDLAPTQPLWTPPNLQFCVEDLEDEQRPWANIHKDADLFFIRSLLQTVRRPQLIIARALQNLRPGGWIECHEVISEVFSKDNTVGPDHPMNRFFALFAGPFADKFGWNLDTSRNIPQLLKDAGFVNIQLRQREVPFGRWPNDKRLREMGMFNQVIAQDMAVTLLSRHAMLGISEEEATALAQDLSDAANDPAIHAFLGGVSVWAQKPG